MIFYFSATGNSKYVAECILSEGEKMISMADAMDKNEYDFHVSEECVGIIVPVYDFTLPSIVSEFLHKFTLSFNKKPYIYFVATYGTTSGASASMANNIMREKLLSFDALFDIKMPDTWTPVFDLSDAKKVQKIINKSDEEIKLLKEQIGSRVKGKHMGLTTPTFTGKIGLAIYNKYTRNTKKFFVEESCIGCGLCEKKCPAHSIEMKNNKPVWIKEKCVMCLGCLHRCPKFSIQYGKGKTRKHGQYRHPYTKI